MLGLTRFSCDSSCYDFREHVQQQEMVGFNHAFVLCRRNHRHAQRAQLQQGTKPGIAYGQMLNNEQCVAMFIEIVA